ncbi:hypothetical protein MPTK1_4g09930 [Marchantia polymorpha subsp. ruderalis]|uniref:Uncharacterized protein n=2 Tax=Marchantia polymorpha TaxID=3197 RepID=A0AAF6B899_MARPO|nr:hypothetical protein MARPO_0132s0036 [Marchantia polymorpha]BBN08233.1 hypothetical protein Mp_4g09930 [Marchantia polymorpha subsp. ruderalis]|eukprot:PTQ29963.1 hypothetical protein MARPO_0132s0036 [Marchantia polymorpha]
MCVLRDKTRSKVDLVRTRRARSTSRGDHKAQEFLQNPSEKHCRFLGFAKEEKTMKLSSITSMKLKICKMCTLGDNFLETCSLEKRILWGIKATCFSLIL